MRLRNLLVLALSLWTVLAISAEASSSPVAFQAERPFRLPFDDAPGAGTWLMVQPYGNTTGAYRQRNSTYVNGQGVHFGVDLSARCGYPVHAIGDGVVAVVDASYGAAPHNIFIRHDDGLASTYGHLLERPDFDPGDSVEAGQVIGLVGDPDRTCTSRPHLHLEIRDHSFLKAFNPVLYIEADWDTLALTGGFSRGFARDLSQPRLWQWLEDQPEVLFGEPPLNEYPDPWPPAWRP